VTGVLTVDGAEQAAALDLSSADRWHVLVLHDGRPAARIDLASPGATLSEAVLSAAILRWADGEAAREELLARLRIRLDLHPPAKSQSPLSCSVVVCTRRRPDDLARLLATLGRLDPAPAEIVVVDNDPGEHDCRAEVLAAGARYVREERRGLNNARNAGIRAAEGEIVVFTDDDCVTPPGWLTRLPAEFADPLVAAVTGPAFPHVLDTPARRRMERQASLARGLQRLEFDWTTFPVTGAGAIGVGANMAFRREVLTALGSTPFPAELDAGTATESGGDTYVIAKLLARGHRVVYDPATFVYHRHREDAGALHRAVFGYGVGLGAALTKLLVEDGELSAPATWMWLLTQYRKTQLRRLAGRADAVETRLAWDYIRGGLHGPLRWLQARREAGPDTASAGPRSRSGARRSTAAAPSTAPTDDRQARSADSAHETDALSWEGREPLLSVIVPTCRRPHALRRCLRALAAQSLTDGSFQVVVVDDSPDADVELDAELHRRLHLVVIRTRGSGAAAARNAGTEAAAAPLLLFLDDDVVAEEGLLRRHLKRHDDEPEETIVVGAYPPHPVVWSLPAAAAALWWSDLFRALARAAAPSYVGALTGNMSISKSAFKRSGRFDPRFGRYRREDWEWGLRALKAGLSISYEPEACGLHEYALDTPSRLRAAELEGYGDVLFLREDPDAACAVLPAIAEPVALGNPLHKLQRAVWRLGFARGLVTATLAGLERGKLRLAWVRLFNTAQRLSYEQGAKAAGARPGERPSEPLLDIDLDGIEPVRLPAVTAPTLRVRVGGQEVARVQPTLGLWTSDLADQIVLATPWAAVERAATSLGCAPSRKEDHDHISHTQVVFGPAHTTFDAAHQARLAEAGAVVSFVEGEACGHWSSIAHALRAGGPALVALTMPGVQPDRRWLDEALVAFDAPRVGAVLGRARPDWAPVAPLVLHSRVSGGEEPQLDAANAPQYVVLRRELLPALALDAAKYGPLGPVMALVEDALEGGWILGYRDVHGLAGQGPGLLQGARAQTAVRMRNSRAPRATACAELRRTTLLAAWRLARGRDPRSAATVLAGALAGLASWP
jgi:GT2 family glycosyltransferase